MKVFLTGGSGFVGNAVIEQLLARGHAIHALVNREPLKNQDDRVKSFPGGLFDDSALDHAIHGCDAVIHLVGIIREKPSAGITFDRIHHQGTQQVVSASVRAGIGRYVQMSALGAAHHSASMYQRTKFLAEQCVQAAALDWTILRPSLIHGPGGEFTQMEQGWASGTSIPFVFMPYFAPGLLGRKPSGKIQPVYVQDVARAFADTLDNEKTIGEIFELGGPEPMTWPQMHRIAASVITGHTKPTLGIPAWYAKALTHLVPPALLPFTRDQVLMSEDDNTCDLTKFINVFGWVPADLESSMRTYVAPR